MSDGFSNPCSERSSAIADQQLNDQGKSLCVGRGTGKRFARRAKRWAELQQRRYNQRLVAIRTGLLDSSEPRSCLYSSFDLKNATVRVVKTDDAVESSPSLGNVRQSISCWISRPCCRDLSAHCSISSFETSLFVSAASIKYATHKNFSVCQVAADSTYSAASSSRPSKHANNHCTAASNTDLTDLLSLITTDLSVTSIPTASTTTVHHSTPHLGGFPYHIPLSSYLSGLDEHLVNTAPPPEREWVMIRHADPDRPIGIIQDRRKMEQMGMMSHL
ncbi:hypothetical protein Y032_0587g345 [Ancylostoma ceylanicum]|uniref:Uncharacterized protein n=1 Tax=Ancylostoma ceylanicum TaxID=53326 RepID=A0A016WN03_9BILA|nr:hypothetical protein Y032_0587g345 [Ancylostoma ceylanicum]